VTDGRTNTARRQRPRYRERRAGKNGKLSRKLADFLQRLTEFYKFGVQRPQFFGGFSAAEKKSATPDIWRRLENLLLKITGRTR